MKSSSISRLLGIPLEWYHSKGSENSLALVTVSNGKEEKSVLISATGFMVVLAKDYVIAPKERAVASKTPVKNAFLFGFKVVGWSMVALFVATSTLTFTKIIETSHGIMRKSKYTANIFLRLIFYGIPFPSYVVLGVYNNKNLKL